MKIPKSVKVGGTVYRVIRNVDRLQLGQGTRGETDFDMSTIELSNVFYGTQSEERTFLHEIIHAILDGYGYKEHDEGVVERIACGLYALLKDNPGIFK